MLLQWNETRQIQEPQGFSFFVLLLEERTVRSNAQRVLVSLCCYIMTDSLLKKPTDSFSFFVLLHVKNFPHNCSHVF